MLLSNFLPSQVSGPVEPLSVDIYSAAGIKLSSIKVKTKKETRKALAMYLFRGRVADKIINHIAPKKVAGPNPLQGTHNLNLRSISFHTVGQRAHCRAWMDREGASRHRLRLGCLVPLRHQGQPGQDVFPGAGGLMDG